jgi:hypothetical protein
MRNHARSLLAGAALISTIGVAQANEPMELSETQMDQVTAGAPVTLTLGVSGSLTAPFRLAVTLNVAQE